MTQAVLVDTGPLYAAVDPDDQYHQQAQSERRRGPSTLLGPPLFPLLR